MPGAEPGMWFGSVKPSSVEAGGDLADFCRCMLAAERRSGNEIFTHREPADDNRLEPDLPNEIRGDSNCALVVAGDRYPDQLARAMRILAQLHIVDCIERTDDMSARQQLRRGETGAPLLLDPLRELVAVASRDRVAHVQHQCLLGEGCPIIFADLLHCRVGDDDRHDIAERDRLLNRAGPRKGTETVDEAFQLIWMTRREHHLVPSLD